MIIFLIGHRGSGKSQLAHRLRGYFSAAGQEIIIVDLDQTIEKGESQTILEIFEKKGEPSFRELEHRYAEKICAEHDSALCPVFISVGAGFPGPIPPPYAPNARCLWVRRPTDSLGRIFLNRPRLNPEISPIEEFLKRHKERTPRYRSWADEELTISEGFDHPNPAEMDFILNTLDATGAVLTLQPEIFSKKNPLSWETFIERRLRWGLKLELRDDLLSPEQLKLALKLIPPGNVLFSIRKNPDDTGFIAHLKEGAIWDWPADGGKPLPSGIQPSIISLHERKAGASVLDAARHLEKIAHGTGAHLKLAVEVHDFNELWQGHQWAEENPSKRSFLPRSQNGRWAWYRLLQKDPSKLNFVREGDGSAPDQPYLLDWVRNRKMGEYFAAVLGDPVLHSRTPAEHYSFFSKRRMSVLAIPVTESEWDQGALDTLQKLGLRAAAVTAPLKFKASHSSKHKTPEAEKFDSVNTLYWSPKENAWTGTNTDILGLEALFKKLDHTQPVAVWGAGGTLPLLEAVLPQAAFYSARTGTPRDGGPAPSSPGTVIWGVGRSRYSKRNSAAWPPASWHPATIVDLNYSEDSPGREFALRTGAKYVSGIAMFRAQAEAQREFWEQCGI